MGQRLQIVVHMLTEPILRIWLDSAK